MPTRLKQYNNDSTNHSILLHGIRLTDPSLAAVVASATMPGEVDLHDLRRGPRRLYLGFVRRFCGSAAL